MGVEDEIEMEGRREEVAKGSGCFRAVPLGTEHVRMYLTLSALLFGKQDGVGSKGRDEEVASDMPFSI